MTTAQRVARLVRAFTAEHRAWEKWWGLRQQALSELREAHDAGEVSVRQVSEALRDEGLMMGTTVAALAKAAKGDDTTDRRGGATRTLREENRRGRSRGPRT